MTTKLVFYTTVTKTYELTFDAFCEMDDVNDLTDEQKQKAWQKMTDYHFNNTVHIETYHDEEEADWEDMEEGITQTVVEYVNEVSEIQPEQ